MSNKKTPPWSETSHQAENGPGMTPDDIMDDHGVVMIPTFLIELGGDCRKIAVWSWWRRREQDRVWKMTGKKPSIQLCAQQLDLKRKIVEEIVAGFHRKNMMELREGYICTVEDTEEWEA